MTPATRITPLPVDAIDRETITRHAELYGVHEHADKRNDPCYRNAAVLAAAMAQELHESDRNRSIPLEPGEEPAHVVLCRAIRAAHDETAATCTDCGTPTETGPTCQAHRPAHELCHEIHNGRAAAPPPRDASGTWEYARVASGDVVRRRVGSAPAANMGWRFESTTSAWALGRTVYGVAATYEQLPILAA